MQAPRSATILVGMFSSLATVIAFAAGATLIWPGSGVDTIWAIRNDDTHAKMLALGWPGGLGLWTLSALALALMVGSFSQRRWAWWAAAVGISLNGLADLGRLATGGIFEGVFGAAVAGLILFWLTRRSVRGQFVN